VEFLKLTSIAIAISCFVGASLGFLVKFIVEQDASISDDPLADAISVGMEDIRQQRVTSLDEFVQEALSRKNTQFA
jgi:hypothetical protein